MSACSGTAASDFDGGGNGGGPGGGGGGGLPTCELWFANHGGGWSGSRGVRPLGPDSSSTGGGGGGGGSSVQGPQSSSFSARAFAVCLPTDPLMGLAFAFHFVVAAASRSGLASGGGSLMASKKHTQSSQPSQHSNTNNDQLINCDQRLVSAFTQTVQ